MLQLIVAIALLYLLYRVVRGSWAASRAFYSRRDGRGREEVSGGTQIPPQVNNTINATIGATGIVFMGLVLFALFGRQLIAFVIMTIMVGISILFWIFFIGLIRAGYQALTNSEEATDESTS
jgi:ABC-type bacteriocin/lantibiotic exporter with double-glycine peptidase domain